MSRGRILVVDDDAAIGMVVGEALRRQDHEVRIAGTISDRRRLLADFQPDVLITDVILPDGNGLDDVKDILAQHEHLAVIVLSAQNTLNTAVRATAQGAFEYLPKPFDLNELCRAVKDALAQQQQSGPQGLGNALDEDGMPLIGRSAPMQEVYRTMARVMGNDLTILVLGESGTGKELVAEAIHNLGNRREGPFVAINMAAIPHELIESELFGHEKGAFTGAQARNPGRFEQAQGGTLFLDEIGDMPMAAQTRLLRVLQSGEFTTVGGTRKMRVDVRIIAATNQDLPRMIEEKRFREDLYYRLAVVPLHLPALRERRDDIGLLARHFLDLGAQNGLPRKQISEEAIAALRQYDWPGNVRELQNLMQRLAVLCREEVIGAGMIGQVLPLAGDPAAPEQEESRQITECVSAWAYKAARGHGVPGGLHNAMLSLVEPALFAEVLRAVDGNQLRAAQILGINRNTLRKKLTDHGLDPALLRRDD